MKKKVFSTLKYLVLLSVGLLFLYLAFRGNNPRELLSALKTANYNWIFLSFLCSILAHLSRAARWNLLIQPLGYKPRLKNTFAAVMAGYLANMAVPRMGEISRCGALNQVENIPFEELLGTVIAERVIDLITLILCIFLTAFLEFDLLGRFIMNQVVSPLITRFQLLFASVLSTLTALAVLLVLIALAVYVLRAASGNPLVKKARNLLKGVLVGLQSVLKMERKLEFFLHSVFIWTMYFLAGYVCFFALSSTSRLGADAGLFSLVAGSIGMTAPVQGGVGVYHMLVSQGLTLFGLSQPEGLVYATVVHTSQVLLILVLGAISLLFISLKKRPEAA